MGKLYVSLIALLCVDFSGQERSFKKTILRKVRPGDNVTLNCDVKNEKYTVWYRNLFNDTQPTLKMEGLEYERNPLPRFSFVWNSSSGSFSLRIENFTESDVGLYYCASAYFMMVYTGQGGKGNYKDIYNEGNVSIVVWLEDDPTVPSPTLPPSSTGLDQNWVLLVSIIPALALICIPLSVFTYWLGKRQGLQISGINKRGSNFEQEEGNWEKPKGILFHTKVIYTPL